MEAETLITDDGALHSLSQTSEGREQLQLQLQQVTAWTRQVKLHLNATAPPISHLPRELLVEIFHILGTTETKEFSWPSAASVTGTSRSRSSRLGWIAVTHVCHEWRELALGNPGLWRNVSFSLGSRWAQCMFERSCRLPVTVRAHMGRPLWSVEDALRIAQCLSWTQELHLSASADCLPTFLKYLETKAPVLHTLSLTSEVYDLGQDEHEIPVPEFDLMSCATPALRHLSARNVYVSFQSCSMLRNLRTLTIVLPSHSNTSWHLNIFRNIYLADFLDALACIPDIEALTLHGMALPLVDRSAAKVVHHVSLPRLVRLELDGEIKTITAMLKHLVLPVVKDVRLTGSSNERMHGGVQTQAMFCRLARLLVPDGNGTLPITELSLSQHFSGAFRFMGTVRHAAAGRDPTSLDLRLHTGSEDLSSSFTFDTLFPEVLAAIPLRPPLSLSITRLNLFAPQWFDALSGHAAVIQSISIDGASFDSFFDFLRIGCLDVVGEVLPHLEVLRLREFAPSDVMRREMVGWLRARKGRHAALRKVVFDRCCRDAVPGRWLYELREMISDQEMSAVVVENPT